MKTVRLTDAGLLLVRGVVGAVFVFHGSQKLFGAFGGHGLEGFAGFLTALGLPAPYFQAVLAASAEFFGGLALLLGAGARLAVVPLAATMAVACYVTSGNGFDVQKGGMEYPFTLGLVLLGLGLTGPGVLSLGRLFNQKSAEARPVSESQLVEGGVR